MIKRFVSLSLVFVLVSSTVVVGSVVSAPPAESKTTADKIADCLADEARKVLNTLTFESYVQEARKEKSRLSGIKRICARRHNNGNLNAAMCAFPSGLTPRGRPQPKPGSSLRYMAVPPPGTSAANVLSKNKITLLKHPERSEFLWEVNCAHPNNGAWTKPTSVLHTNRTALYPGRAEVRLVHPIPNNSGARACSDQRYNKNERVKALGWKCPVTLGYGGDPLIVGADWHRNDSDKGKINEYEITANRFRWNSANSNQLVGPNSRYYTRGARLETSKVARGCGDDNVWLDGERVRASSQVFCPGVAKTHVNYFDRDPRANIEPGIDICFNTTNCGYGHNQPTPQSGGSWGLHRAHYETWQYRTVRWEVLRSASPAVFWREERNQTYKKTTTTPLP